MDVWYAAYGSNLLRERFLMYLRGGPVPGSGRMQRGARNPADPVADQPYRIDRTLQFGAESAGWEGKGVCFLDPHRDVPADTLGRAWLLTAEQLADVWAQENGAGEGPEVDLGRLAAEGWMDFGSGWYRRLDLVGELDGLPVATFTYGLHGVGVQPALNAAGLAYLAVVGRGLIETWGLTAGEAATYLASRSGNRGQVDPADLEQALGG